MNKFKKFKHENRVYLKIIEYSILSSVFIILIQLLLIFLENKNDQFVWRNLQLLFIIIPIINYAFISVFNIILLKKSNIDYAYFGKGVVNTYLFNSLNFSDLSSTSIGTWHK